MNSHWNGFSARIWKLIHWKMFPVYVKWMPDSLAIRRLIWDYYTVKFRSRIKKGVPGFFIPRSFTDTCSNFYTSFIPVRFYPLLRQSLINLECEDFWRYIKDMFITYFLYSWNCARCIPLYLMKTITLWIIVLANFQICTRENAVC